MQTDPDFEEIATERLRLRRSRPEDAEAISVYRSDPEVHRYQGWDRLDPVGIRSEIERMADRLPGEAGGWVQLTAELRDTGQLVGDVGMSPADDDPTVIKLGYTMAPEFQGKGFATEAIAALIEYAFDRLDARVARIYASAENTPSIRVAEKVGMVLVERFEREYEGETWHGVRYERRRDREP
jgi:RimJ/RimL family protein N-acetyltransferase